MLRVLRFSLIKKPNMLHPVTVEARQYQRKRVHEYCKGDDIEEWSRAEEEEEEVALALIVSCPIPRNVCRGCCRSLLP